MSQRYWLPILALIGLPFLAGAGQPQKSPPSEGTSAHAQQMPAPALSAESYSSYSDKCYDTKDHDAADLCAQWRAAIAAEKAANASVIGNWIGGVGAILSLAALIAVVISLRQTRRALRISAKEFGCARIEAKKGLRIAEESLIAGERPWLAVEARITSPLRFVDGHGHVNIEFTVKNIGKTPAIEVLVYSKIIPWHFDAFDRLHEEFSETLEVKRKGPAKLGRVVFPTYPEGFLHHLDIWPKHITQITRNGQDPLIAPDVLCCVAYVNPATNEQHETGCVFHLRRSGDSGNSIDTRGDGLKIDELELSRAIVGGYVT